MQVRCPLCHNPVEILDDSSQRDIPCASCGNDFSLATDETPSMRHEECKRIAHFQLLEKLGAKKDAENASSLGLAGTQSQLIVTIATYLWWYVVTHHFLLRAVRPLQTKVWELESVPILPKLSLATSSLIARCLAAIAQ